MTVPVRSRLSAAERRRDILRAATVAFARSNYRATGVARIAREAGVSEPLLYRHFASKRDLYCAVLERIGRRIIEIWEAATVDVDDPLDALRVAGEVYVTNLRTHPDEERLQFQALAETADAQIAAVLRETHLGYVNFFEQRIREGQRRGSIRTDVDATSAAWLLDGSGFTFTMQDLLDAAGPRQHAVTIDLLLDWLAPSSSTRTSAPARAPTPKRRERDERAHPTA